MNVTSIVRSDDQPSVDCSRCGAALLDNCQEYADAVHLNGRGPQKGKLLFENRGLRIDSLGTLKTPLLHGEFSASRQVTQNDIVVLAGAGEMASDRAGQREQGGHSAQGRI